MADMGNKKNEENESIGIKFVKTFGEQVRNKILEESYNKLNIKKISSTINFTNKYLNYTKQFVNMKLFGNKDAKNFPLLNKGYLKEFSPTKMIKDFASSNISNFKHQVNNVKNQFVDKKNWFDHKKGIDFKDRLKNNLSFLKKGNPLKNISQITAVGLKGAKTILKGNLIGTLIDAGFATADVISADPRKKAETGFKKYGGVIGGLGAGLLVGALASTGIGLIPLLAGGLILGTIGSMAGEKAGEELYKNKGKISSGAKWIWGGTVNAFSNAKNNYVKNSNMIHDFATNKNGYRDSSMDRFKRYYFPQLNPQYYINGRHASGLSNVPFDGYIAELHKGERVMTASENKGYSNKSTSRGGNVFNISINGVNRSSDEIMNDLVTRIRDAFNTMGEVACD